MATDDAGNGDLTRAQRTLFRAVKRRFGERLGLKDSDLMYAVRRMFVPAPYARGKTILRAGDCLDLFTVLGAGAVKVICTYERGRKKKTVAVQIVNDGHAFALPSLQRPLETRHFDDVAQSPALVGLLTSEALAGFVDRLDGQQRLRLVTYGWKAYIGLLLEKRLLLSLPVADRIWYALARVVRRFTTGDGANSADLHLTQGDIGQLVGATRSTVNRRLKQLGSEIVSQRQGCYRVHREPPFLRTSFAGPCPRGGSSINDEATRRAVLNCLRQQAGRVGLSPAAARAFAEHARLVICPPEAQIALPERDESLSLLITGAARIECPGPDAEPLSLLFAKPGWLLFGGIPQTGRVGFRAIAQVESCAAMLTNDGLMRVLDAMTAAELVHFLSFGWRVLSHHLWRSCLFLMMDEKERLLHQLFQLAHDFPAAHAQGTLIDLDLSVADIARLTAADATRVARHLHELRRERHLEFVTDSSRRIVMLGARPGAQRDRGRAAPRFGWNENLENPAPLPR